MNGNIKLFGWLFLYIGSVQLVQSGQADLFQKHTKAELKRVSVFAQINENSNAYIERSAELVTRPDAPATIVLCHGFMCNKDDMRFLRSSLFSNYNTLIFDFRAHGDVKGDQPCTFGKNEIFDVIGAVGHIKSDPKLAKKPIIAYGFSMGAASIINAYAHVPDLFDTVILDCPFESIEGVMERGMEKLKFSLFGHEFGLPGRNMLRKYAYNAYAHYLLKMVLKSVAQVDTSHINTSIEVVSTEQAAQKLDIPALFIACENDEKTPLEAVRTVYDKVPGVKRLWMSDGRGHFDTFFSHPEEYKYRVNTFIKKVLGKRFIDKNKEKITDTRIIKKGE